MDIDPARADAPDPLTDRDQTVTALAHLYRGEMHRMTVWRQRLDVTNNWAILLTVGLTTFALGSPSVPHYSLLLGLGLIAISIAIESRRYQHLHHSIWRLRLLETGFFVPLVSQAVADPAACRRLLAADLVQPELRLGIFAAACARLRRNYLMLFYFITAVWVTKLFVHPHDPASVAEFYDRMAVGALVPKLLVVVSAALFVVVASILALLSRSCETLEGWPRCPRLRGCGRDRGCIGDYAKAP